MFLHENLLCRRVTKLLRVFPKYLAPFYIGRSSTKYLTNKECFVECALKEISGIKNADHVESYLIPELVYSREQVHVL